MVKDTIDIDQLKISITTFVNFLKPLLLGKWPLFSLFLHPTTLKYTEGEKSGQNITFRVTNLKLWTLFVVVKFFRKNEVKVRLHSILIIGDDKAPSQSKTSFRLDKDCFFFSNFSKMCKNATLKKCSVHHFYQYFLELQYRFPTLHAIPK